VPDYKARQEVGRGILASGYHWCKSWRQFICGIVAGNVVGARRRRKEAPTVYGYAWQKKAVLGWLAARKVVRYEDLGQFLAVCGSTAL